MLGYASEERLKALLIAVGDGERDLEAARQRLCSIRDFALHSAFERVDRDSTNWVSSKELVDYLRDNGVFHVSDAEAFDLVKFFDMVPFEQTFDLFERLGLPAQILTPRLPKVAQSDGGLTWGSRF